MVELPLPTTTLIPHAIQIDTSQLTSSPHLFTGGKSPAQRNPRSSPGSIGFCARRNETRGTNIGPHVLEHPRIPWTQPLGEPCGSFTGAASYGLIPQSATHSHTFPSMSYRPKSFSCFCATS